MSTVKQRRTDRVQKWQARYWARVQRAESDGDPRAKFDAAVDLLRTALNNTTRERRDLVLAQLTATVATEAEAILQRYIVERKPT
ncbi:hypothetical protein [Amycolatopsis australiensis]|uniref:Uncharacterized protein n=1 Tax=Amycolatopsis australiensis TaxID=546364 RepID=A0A1K1LLJ6_9PSEU|nr:hypothetical protein [Amycolatopsis australiensis]SFW11760.1 hypothetical protein SAMN04489730_0055 [Amycolatopsis australiensis]